eukprot:694533-Amphidinium_carterae.2
MLLRRAFISRAERIAGGAISRSHISRTRWHLKWFSDALHWEESMGRRSVATPVIRVESFQYKERQDTHSLFLVATCTLHVVKHNCKMQSIDVLYKAITTVSA